MNLGDNCEEYSMIHSLIMAFSMYSRIPVPQVAWKEENRTYALCFFPLIGVIIGGGEAGLWVICRHFGVTAFLYGVLAVTLPILVTGGIHMDGYLDVQDAKACLGDREQKRAVMKDARVGAFAVMHCCLYFLLQAGCFCELYQKGTLFVVAGSFVFSRALSGLAAVTFPSAVSQGSLKQFTASAQKRVTVVVEFLYLAVVMGGMLYGSLAQGLAAIGAAVFTFGYYKWFSMREFGGITGDLAGYFLQLCELGQLLAVTVVIILLA